jgi:hypothetical protein
MQMKLDQSEKMNLELEKKLSVAQNSKPSDVMQGFLL